MRQIYINKKTYIGKKSNERNKKKSEKKLTNTIKRRKKWSFSVI